MREFAAMVQFVNGAVMMSFLGIAFFFLRFWKATGDRFFRIFSAAFLLLAVERLALGLLVISDEATSYVYLIRLAAFIVILWAIIDKNRASQP